MNESLAKVVEEIFKINPYLGLAIGAGVSLVLVFFQLKKSNSDIKRDSIDKEAKNVASGQRALKNVNNKLKDFFNKGNNNAK